MLGLLNFYEHFQNLVDISSFTSDKPLTKREKRGDQYNRKDPPPQNRP